MVTADREYAIDLNAVHYGAAVGTYSVLELLGFAFIHPLDPYIPSGLNTLTTTVSIIFAIFIFRM